MKENIIHATGIERIKDGAEYGGVDLSAALTDSGRSNRNPCGVENLI